MRAQRPKARRRAQLPAFPPRTVPREYTRLFGRIDPNIAVKVADYIQRTAVDRFQLVEVMLLKIANELGQSRATAYRNLRAGRWLIGRKWRTWPR